MSESALRKVLQDPLRFYLPLKPQFICFVSKSLQKRGLVKKLYFVKQNYEIFSTEASAREKHGQNSCEPHQGVTGSLGISSVVRPF